MKIIASSWFALLLVWTAASTVLCQTSGIPFRYYGYYYGGKQGTIQLLTFTGRDLFAKYEHEFSDFLNGLEIY